MGRSRAAMAGRPENVGILAMDVYFPACCVRQVCSSLIASVLSIGFFQKFSVGIEDLLMVCSVVGGRVWSVSVWSFVG